MCHLDFWTKNLIKRSDGRLVLLDWAFVGDGAMGEDIGNLVPGTAFDHFIAAESLLTSSWRLSRPTLTASLRPAFARIPDSVELPACLRLPPPPPRRQIRTGSPRPCCASASTVNHVRYGGTEAIDPDFRYRERGLALLNNAPAMRPPRLSQRLP